MESIGGASGTEGPHSRVNASSCSAIKLSDVKKEYEKLTNLYEVSNKKNRWILGSARGTIN